MDKSASMSCWRGIAAALSIMLGSSIAEAGILWSTVGSTGHVDEQGVGSYAASRSVMGFRPGAASSSFNAYYDIPVLNIPDRSGSRGLIVRFSRTRETERIRVALVRHNLVSGVTSNVVTFDSNSSAPEFDFQRRSVCFNHNFDFQTYAYFIQATFSRASSSDLSLLQSIAIDDFCVLVP